MTVRRRTYVQSWEIPEILKSSFQIGASIGGIAAFLALCVTFSSSTPFMDMLIALLKVFGLFFAGGSIFGLSFQFLDPVVFKFSRNLHEESQTNVALGIAALLAIGSMIGIYSGWSSIQENRIAPYMAHIDEYLAQPTDTIKQGQEQIIGKIIVVNLDTNKIDDFYLKLPGAYRPQSAEEVSTVLWLRYGETNSSQLSNGGRAYRVTCEITSIDLSQKAIIAHKTFTGDRPVVPSHGAAGSSFPGPAPHDQIIQFIQSLPHQ